MNSLKYLKVRSSGQVAEKLAEVIIGQLAAGKNVLWLLSGGSAIDLAVRASKLLDGRDLSDLSISLADERYGDPGHQDSNWQKIIDQGFVFGNAGTYPVLSGYDPEQTVVKFDEFLKRELQGSSFKLALLGIGTDGHTAGILPGSPAVDSIDYAAYYQAEDYKRITITPKGLALMDRAVVYCRGVEKSEAIANLERDLPIAAQPAQIIKQIAKVSVYNDIKGA